MNRRESVLALIAFGMPAVPLRVRAQGKMRRIGLLLPSISPALSGAFRKRLAALGWIEGQNFLIESLYAESRNDRLAALAAELVRRNVEVIVTSTTPGALAAKASTSTIPIVFAHVANEVGIEADGERHCAAPVCNTGISHGGGITFNCIHRALRSALGITIPQAVLLQATEVIE